MNIPTLPLPEGNFNKLYVTLITPIVMSLLSRYVPAESMPNQEFVVWAVSGVVTAAMMAMAKNTPPGE